MPAHRYNQSRVTLKERMATFRRIMLVIAVLFLVLLGFMIFGTMEDLVKGNGTVAGIREYDLKTLVSAKTVKIFHHEGEEVNAGEPLVEFDSRNQLDEIDRLKNQVRELQLQISVKSKDLELLKRDPLPDYYRQTKLQLDGARERFDRTKHELEVYRKLYDQKVVTRRDFLKVEMEHLANQQTVLRLEEDWKKLQDGLDRQILAKAEEELRLLRQRLAGKEDEVKMAIRRLEDYILRAPDGGILTDIPPRAGGYYEKGESVIKFAANHNKKVIGLIDEKQIFKVEPGQPVRISCKQYNYLDYGYFAGLVDAVYQLPVEINGVNYYPVKIVLVNEQQPLRFGSSCEVSIITGRERIIFALMGIKSKDYLKRRGINKPKFLREKGKKAVPGEVSSAVNAAAGAGN